MNKLQYDSFYKFLVSVGIILITAPIIGIYYYFTGTDDILITQEEFAQLSEFSLQSLNNRMAISRIISSIFPWFCFLLMAFGIFCVIYGCIKWHKIQTDLDEQTHLDTVMKRLNAEKLTPSEVAESKINEAFEDGEISSSESNVLPSRKQAIIRGFQIEDMFFKYISKKLHKNYDIQQNIRVGDKEYDIVAISKRNGTDYVFEIKAWNNSITHSLYRNTLQRLKIAAENYGQLSNRKYIAKLVIVSQPQYIEEFKEHFGRILNNPKNNFDCDIEYYTEEQLSK